MTEKSLAWLCNSKECHIGDGCGRRKGNCEKEVEGVKEVSGQGCDAEIFKPERNVKWHFEINQGWKRMSLGRAHMVHFLLQWNKQHEFIHILDIYYTINSTFW